MVIARLTWYSNHKYFRDDTKDREETLDQRTNEMKAAATIDIELFETNLSLIKAPFDEYLKVLKKPLYPID